MPLRIPLLLLLLCFTLGSQAQRFYFENVGVQSGLPASKVYDVLEDPDGMIWIGTEAGISRFDGTHIVNFGTSDGVAAGGARCFLLDDQKRIWVGHLGGGITLFTNGKGRSIKTNGFDLRSDVSNITQDKEGNIWMATYGSGALRVDRVNEDGTIQCAVFSAEQGVDDKLMQVHQLPNGPLCLINDAGSLFIKDQGDSFKHYLPKGLPQEELVFTVHNDQNGDLWVGTRYGGAYQLDAKGLKARYHIGNGMPSNFVMSFGEDAEGRMWIGTFDKGICRIQSNGIQRFHERNGMHDNMIRCISRDREGNMLLGTNINGLDIFKGERFIGFNEADGLVDPQVWAVMEDRQGRMWFGTFAGISLWDPNDHGTGRVKNITSQQGELNSNRVRCMKEDATGRVWIGTDNAGLILFDPRTYRSSENLEVRVADGRVTALEVGQPGEIWVGTLAGLIRHVPGSVPVTYTTENGLSSANIVSLYRDPQGTLWVGGTMNGISRVDNGIARPVDIGRPFTASCFIQDKEGRLWVGTEGQGVFVLKDEKLVAVHTSDEGLLSNTIKALNIDADGQVWIGSSRGLNRWTPGKEGFVSYTERAGYTGIETKPNATCITRAGHIWFGTANGATRVSAEKALDQVPAPLISIRGLRVNLEERPLEEGISFPHGDNNIRIAFGSVSLSDPAAVQYSYMLDGVESEWQPPSTTNEAHYPALQPGRYVFKVKAMNRSGAWSEPPAEFTFTILPPWYRSWWFYTVLAVVIGISLFSYIKVREQQLRKRNQMLEKKVQERTAEVVAQSKEIEGQKVEIEGLLLNILPREISEELKVNGKATARRHDDVTVLFTDMKGFTKAAEKMTPEELVHELDECFIRFDEITSRYGIEKIKTIGDSYMCACGVPTSDPHHAVKSVLAALEVRELMERWRQEREAKGKEPWILRIGIHTGPVVAGVVGRRKFAYDIWGDTVNTASRMESSGVPGEVNISGSTFELIKDHFECEHRGQVEAKNKGRIDMYFVRRLKQQFSGNADGSKPSEKLLAQVGVTQPVEEFA